ncbi:MAG: helix-turn-helix domain-containing protein [Thermodesulfobacteriota bacterium]
MLPESGCPIDFAATVFGDRWTLLILRDLARGKRHFKNMLGSDEGIAANILSARLKRLERFGLVERRVDPASRRQVLYELTEKGLDLAPIMVELALWSAKYDPHTLVTRDFVARARSDREGLIRDTMQRLAPKGGAEGACVHR